MALTAEKEMQHIGKTKGVANHDHDLIHELSQRLDALWRYDQYMENAKDRDELRDFWSGMKDQEQQNVQQLKDLIAGEVQRECF